jgi:iron complex transport system ATP-binding protein
MINCKNITVALNGQAILQNISCNIPRNAFTAIIGRNGSGKTTLAGCICKQMKYSGSITVDSVDLKEISTGDLSKKISYLPQVLPAPDVTVEELVSFGRMPQLGFQKKLTKEDLLAIETAIQKSQLQDFRIRKVSSLSGGERQKAFLAMTLAQETDILLLDEPNVSMDASSQLQFLELLKSLTMSGKTVVAILHDLSLACEFADHIIIMDSGKCVFSGSKNLCLSQNMIEDIFCVNRYDAKTNDITRLFFR